VPRKRSSIFGSQQQRGQGSSLATLVCADRKAHGEYRALAGLARHHHVPAHHARELARDGKTQPSAAKALRRRGIGLTEFLEHPRLLLWGHAYAAIGDGDLNPVASVNQPSSFERDLALLGELAGVRTRGEEMSRYECKLPGWALTLQL
jgi:hypothetical protein